MRNLVLSFLIIISGTSAFCQVGIGTTTPNASAQLEINSSTSGFLPPRMTTIQRNAIVSPAAGLVIYNTSESALNYYNGITWMSLFGTPPGGAQTPGQSCKQLLQVNPTAPSGIYYIDPDGAGSNPAFPCYCDMTTQGGGWTLVASNSASTTAPTPNWATATGSTNTVVGSINPGSGDTWMGLTNWSLIGTELIYQVGSTPFTITNSAKYNFTIGNSANFYRLTLSNENILTGGVSPSLFGAHNNASFSTYDVDHDGYSGNCSSSYGNTPWWYTNCWLGSLYGNGGTSGASWTGPTTPFAWGAIWVR